MENVVRISLAVSLLGAFQLGASHAAPTIVKDHYEEYAEFGCAFGSTCRMNFSLTPANKLLLVRFVSCHVTMPDKPIYIVNLGTSPTASGDSIRPYALEVPAPGNQVGGFTYSFGQEIAYLVGPTRYPHVSVQATGSTAISFRCTITGVLQNP